MKYVNDAASILFLIMGVVLLCALVKIFFLDTRKSARRYPDSTAPDERVTFPEKHDG